MLTCFPGRQGSVGTVTCWNDPAAEGCARANTVHSSLVLVLLMELDERLLL